MKEGYTHICFLLDRSRSMQTIKNDTIGGFNTFIQEQKKAEGVCTFSMAQFDDKYDVVYDFTDIKGVEELNSETFVPRGMTALYDAAGKLMTTIGEDLRNMKDSDRPEKVIFVILTDGEENASKEYSHARVADMIKHQTEKYEWEFVFLGANIKAQAVSSSLNIKLGNTITFDANAKGVDAVFSSVACNLTSYRSAAKSDVSGQAFAFFKGDDYDKQSADNSASR